MNDLWDILGQRQGILSNKTLDANADAVGDAWAACSRAVVAGGGAVDQSGATRLSSSSSISSSISRREDLVDAALRAWFGVNLLGDPCGTLVEVKNKEQRRKLRGQ